jgi:ATP-binding cassette subfamily B protein/subfamily B ATP-binding cassette protein MsbA
MAEHRRQKVSPTAIIRAPLDVATSGAFPVTDSPTTLIPAVSPEVATAPPVRVRDIFRRFWPNTRGFRGRLFIGLLLIGVPPLLSAAGLWLFKILIDDVLTKRNVALFPMVAGAFVAVTVLEGVVSFVDEYLTAWTGERFVLNLRTRVFTHLQKLPLTFFERHQLGDILTRLTGDIGTIETLVLSGVNQALTYLFQIVFFGGALFVLDWRLAVAALIAAPFFLLLARAFSKRIKRASQDIRRRSGSITSVAEESLRNTALVQAYHRQDDESVRFHRENLGSFTAQMVAIKLEALFAPFTDLLQAIGVLAVMGYGLRELVAGRISLGGLLVFVGYLSQLYGPISGFGGLSNSVYAASAGAERVIELLDTRPEVLDPGNPVTLTKVRGEVRLDRVGYRYPDSGRPALAEVSFYARPGETVAVVGASGAGKSTLLRILLRLHDPHSGSVTLDGVDARDLRLGQLRENIAVVLQDTLVFDGTVAENIQWGRPDATPDDVVAAARAADAHGFVSGLPQGYHTRVGQRGMMLSGGQRQRIALARAMIRNAPVLLLDEPTTGLDAVSTQRVMEPLRRAMAGRTTIVISHNLLTVADADRIVYLEHGRVAGCGTHDELMARARGYAELYRLHHPEPRRPSPMAGPRRPAPGAPAPAGRGGPRAGIPARPEPPRATRPTHPGRPGPSGPPRPSPRPDPRPRPVPGPPLGSRPVPVPRPTPVPDSRPVHDSRPTPAPDSGPIDDSHPTPVPDARPGADGPGRSPAPAPVTPAPRPVAPSRPAPVGVPASLPRPVPVARPGRPLPIPVPRPGTVADRPQPSWPSDEPAGHGGAG